jgi:hypothetical protein
MDEADVQAFQEVFRAWLRSDPEVGARVAAWLLGYSLGYVRWVAGLAGQRPWPGSVRFVEQMEPLGCTNRLWRERTPEELAWAFRQREVLYDPRQTG